MHQIYSCSDENIEVFTTVIPSKVTSPARRRVKSSQHLLTKNVIISENTAACSALFQLARIPTYQPQVTEIHVTAPPDTGILRSGGSVVIESDLYAPRPLELLPHRTDRRDGEGRRSGRFQNPRLQGPHPAKTPARPVGTSEPKSANLCGNRTYGKALMPPVARISVKAPTVLEAAAPGSENVAVLTRGSRHLKKMTEEFPTLPQGAEASLPLTGSAPCGMPSILRKMWTRHKKKSEYVGATNSAFEAD